MQLKEAQSLSLATAIKGGEEWTSTEVQMLNNLRANGVTYYAIAQMMNRSVYAVTTMARVTGIAKERAPKQAPKVVACEKCYLVHKYDCEY